GGSAAVAAALKSREAGGWRRSGLFGARLAAAQFATTAAVDMLRSLRTVPERPEAVHLAASAPANPYGAILPWPAVGAMARAAGGGGGVGGGGAAGGPARRETSHSERCAGGQGARARVGAPR